MLRTLSIATCMTLLASGLAPAQANDPGSMLGLGLRAVVQGKQLPAITLRPRAAVKKVSVLLSRDGFQTKLKSGKIRAGATKELRFKQPTGVFHYQAKFDVHWGSGERSEFTTTFKITRVGELELKIGAGNVDMEARRMTFQITNPAKKAELLML